MINSTILQKISQIVGKNNYLDSQEDRISYSYDGTPLLHSLPDAIVIPQTKEQISAVLTLANEEHFAIVPRGSGSGLSGGSIPVENSIVLLMSHWNKILEVDAENLTVLVEPGVITADIHAAVEKLGLFYPPDPGSMNICTIGGNVAENAGGLRGLKYGVTTK
jgi:glycolate oxidase